jgi:hypothetical protein
MKQHEQNEVQSQDLSLEVAVVLITKCLLQSIGQNVQYEKPVQMISGEREMTMNEDMMITI